MADRKIRIKVTTTGARDVKNLGALFSALGTAIPLVTIALGALAIAAVKVTKVFVEFQRRVAEIKTLALDTGKTIGDFADELLRVKKNIPLAELNDLTAAMYKYISATGDVEGAEDALNKIGEAAIANQATVSSVTDMLSRVMTNFGKSSKDADDIFDKFTATIVNANSTGEEFAFVAGDMAAATNFAGLAMEDMMAVYAAGTQALDPRKVAFGWQSLTANVVNNRKTFEKWGIETGNVNDMIGDLVELQGKMSAEEFAELRKNLVPDMRGLKLLNALIANYDGLTRSVKEINDAQGLMGEAYETMAETAAAKYAAIGASLEAFKIKAGELFNEIAERFVDAFTQESIDKLLEYILDLITLMLPVLEKIAETIGTWIGDATDKWVKDLEKINDLMEMLYGITNDTNEEMSKSEELLNKILQSLNPLLGITEQFLWYWNAIVGTIEVVVNAVQRLKDEIAGLTLFIELVKGGVSIEKAYKAAAKIQEQLKTKRTLEADYTDDLDARIAFEERLGAEAGKAYWEKWLGERSKAFIKEEPEYRVDLGGVGPREAVGGIGIDETGDRKDIAITESETAKTKKSAAEIERDNIRNEWGLQAEEDRINKEVEKILRLKDEQIAAEEKEREKADKARAKSISEGLIGAIRSGNVLNALKSIFLDSIWKFVSEALTRAIVKSGILALLNIFSGGTTGGIQGAFGAKGFTEFSGKLLKLAYGGAFGAGVHKLNKATPAIIGERGPEIAAAIPLNQNGVNIVAGDIIPALEQATGVKFGGDNGKVVINVSERAGQLVEIHYAEMATKGNRVLSNDVGA